MANLIISAPGRVLTMEPAMPRADAVGLAGDRIAAVGPLAAVRATVPDGTLLELPGVVLPVDLVSGHSRRVDPAVQRRTDHRQRQRGLGRKPTPAGTPARVWASFRRGCRHYSWTPARLVVTVLATESTPRRRADGGGRGVR